MLNPIIILDGSKRSQLGRHYLYQESDYDREQLSLLKAFDPDLLINYSSSTLPEYLAAFRERTHAPDVMRWNPWGTEEMISFLEVWPFLEEHWRKKVRFLAKPPAL